MAAIIIPKSPTLPLADVQYNPAYQNRYSSILRLYFNQLDTVNSGILGPLGMQYLDSPHIAASDSTSQYATANNTPKLVSWDTAASVKGFTLNPTNTATATVSGVYKIDYSLQLANTANTTHDVYVWLRVNGGVIPNSSSQFTLQARKSTGSYTYIVAYSSVVFEADEGDAIGLWWATDQAYISGVQDGVYMPALPAQTTPYVRPANPSAIGSISFLGRR